MTIPIVQMPEIPEKLRSAERIVESVIGFKPWILEQRRKFEEKYNNKKND